MGLAINDFASLALDLTSGVSAQDRFDRLLTTVRTLLDCDASALLVFRGDQFTPLAINGLATEVLGRRFVVAEHPRLEAIARAGDVVRFPADSDLPDPYDGLIPSHDDTLKVHACVGLPLVANQRLIGALTIDDFNPRQFDRFSDADLRTVSALAAASLNNALLMEKLEQLSGQLGVSLPGADGPPHQSGEIIGQSPAMLALKREIEVVAKTDLTALVLGQTGTGKELVAEAIHGASLRAGKPLIYLNCAALPESVAESELFGHVKGAFTGAISHRQGKFELADGGTLFLDEVGELSLGLQAKLLRVLQYGDLQRVGSDKAIKVDVRIIAATNRDLRQEVLDKRFRADLYHRLSVFPLQVPPLEQRGDDLLLLAGFFLERWRSKLGLSSLRLDEASRRLLMGAAWPGNVRELEHCLHRATVLARAESPTAEVVIHPRHLDRGPTTDPQAGVPAPVSLPGADPGLGFRQATEQFQQRLIRQTLEANGGNWAASARDLGLDTGNLHRLAKRLGMK
ncbi:nitric oxide reductase transcriptional regulator NorR [Ferrimonas sediminicola]|uniref:Nitric oxide reductase transcriptional regulator NorR n=1 Tax=Ferrimonas sediminicola TaxID=2569538 RepID=A0A4U1BJN9_9GAMM|nr:nitric oxide reductase transcriptional regulator NorR [Ferrimonas sediminicola]TKB50340.1 nitric oxide reductase transcriptional regulator NorR [Ferrimonas sediminicola]